MNLKHKQVIIWGYALHTHTHSYIHYGMYKAFKDLGFETYWIDPKKGWIYEGNPSNINFKDALIFSEYFADTIHIPRWKNSTYAVHYVGNKNHVPGAKEFLGKVGRFIDIRHCPMYYWEDKNYTFTMDDNIQKWVSKGCRLEKSPDYDRLYMNWATDLLPQEFNFEDRKIKREKVSYFIGTIGGGRGGLDDCQKAPDEYDNVPALKKFRQACIDAGVEFKSNCPWIKPMSDADQKSAIQKSWVVPDIRHPAMKAWGYIPCRVMKNISYGQVGATNSRAVYDFFEQNVVYNDDPYQLFFDCQSKMNDLEFILSQMNYVQKHHTYINRVKDLINLVNNP